MTTVTAQGAETYEFTLHDSAVTTSPPSIVVTARGAHDPDGLDMEFRHKGRGLAVTEAQSGIVLASSKPGRAHEHTVFHRGRDWHLSMQRSWWGSDRPFRRGFLACPESGVASIESSYLHYVSEWRHHRRLHRGWTTGSVLIEGDVPSPVLVLAVRLTLGTAWFDQRTGMWNEVRREWDFGGF